MPAVGKVLVVGGGIAGMTLAIALKRTGIEEADTKLLELLTLSAPYSSEGNEIEGN